MKPTRDDLAAYAMGNYDGDVAALEAVLAADETLHAQLAQEAELEMLLRDAAAAATFCPACDDLVKAERCTACGAAVRPGGYVVEKVLVANAHGRMYMARDADGKQVALKELAFVQSPGADAVAAFEREAKFLRALEHPAIPRFVAAFEEGEGVHTRYYLAQELVTGQALDARLDEHFFSEAEIVELARSVLQILVYLQGLSPMVIHRDIKPANLVKRSDGSIALVDFGAAHVQGTTAGSTSIGTFGYMPIEQLAGQVDATTDVYALGATLVHLLTRQEPWRILNADLIGTINVSQRLRRCLEKLVAPRREDRFAGAAAALAGLDARDAVPVKPARAPWLRSAAIAGLSVAALAGAGALGFALRGHAEQPEPSRRADLRWGSGWDAFGAAVPAHEWGWGWGTAPATPPVPPVPPVPAKPPMPPAPPAEYVNATRLSAEFTAVPIADVLRAVSKGCNVNIVVPDYVKAAVTTRFNDVPCDAAIEVLLEAHELWYRYRPEGRLIEVLPRRQLDFADEAALQRATNRISAETLPAGPTIDLDLQDAPLQEVVQRLATRGSVNIVMPDYIKGKVTIRLTKVPWDTALRAVLAVHELGFEYRDSGHVLRIASQRELDREDEAARARGTK